MASCEVCKWGQRPSPVAHPRGQRGAFTPVPRGHRSDSFFFFLTVVAPEGEKPSFCILGGLPASGQLLTPKQTPPLASGLERGGFGAARPKLARQQICPLAANLRTLFCLSVPQFLWTPNGIMRARTSFGGCSGLICVECQGWCPASGKCSGSVVSSSSSWTSPPPPPHTPFSMPNDSGNLVQGRRPPESEVKEPPTAPAGCCCHLLVTTGTGPTQPHLAALCVRRLPGAARRPGSTVTGKHGELTGVSIDRGGLLDGWQGVRRARDGGGGEASPSRAITRVHARPHGHARTCST